MGVTKVVCEEAELVEHRQRGRRGRRESLLEPEDWNGLADEDDEPDGRYEAAEERLKIWASEEEGGREGVGRFAHATEDGIEEAQTHDAEAK